MTVAVKRSYFHANHAAPELLADVAFMLSLVWLHPDDASARQRIIGFAAEWIRAELAARADPDVAKAAAGVRR